jgi:prepilin-type N-terminal cleavage/methylation domain-containing protein
MEPMSNNRGNSFSKRQWRSESGFSLLEMVVAMMVLTIGLLAVASAISYALLASNRGRGVTNSKMLVVSILEQMETLRDTGQLHFNEISNSQVVGSNFTGFPSTFQPVSTIPGPDGIFGTADDLIDAGTDGVYGGSPSDDFSNPLRARPGVTRQILISTLPDNDYLKKIQVTLRYSLNGSETRDLVCSGYLNDNEHGNYVP